MTSALFLELLGVFNEKMRKAKRRVLLLSDNASVHTGPAYAEALQEGDLTSCDDIVEGRPFGTPSARVLASTSGDVGYFCFNPCCTTTTWIKMEANQYGFEVTQQFAKAARQYEVAVDNVIGNFLDTDLSWRSFAALRVADSSLMERLGPGKFITKMQESTRKNVAPLSYFWTTGRYPEAKHHFETYTSDQILTNE
jgi:hypothetical protein